MLLVLLVAFSACGSSKPPAPSLRAAATMAPSPTASSTAQATSEPTPAATATPQHYVVRTGDTLGLIAARHHVSVNTVIRANNLSGSIIRTGQMLLIPAPSATLTVIPETQTPVADTSPAKIIDRGRADTNSVALTFDAGADAGYAKLILDTLERNGIHATFGMTGRWAEQNPNLVKRIAADGDEFINHTWDHASWTGRSLKPALLSQKARWAELDRTEALIHQLTGDTTLPYFRSPFGDVNHSVLVDAGLRGYRYDVLWTVDSRGWAGASVAQIVSTCVKGAVPGAILILHVGAQSQDGPALQSIIDGIKQKGLGFATISQVVGP